MCIRDSLERLRTQGLLDDRRYAREYVRTQSTRRGLGPAALRARLAQLGVESGLVEETLTDELPDHAQESIALTLARKRLSHLQRSQEKDSRPRLWRFLVQRGFDHDLSARVVDRVLLDGEE